jgi:peptidoglycan/LPS O-acetylase OafA/YrhL
MVRYGAFADSPADRGSLSLPTTDWIIEGWRGVAAWLVVYAHFWAFTGTDWPPLRLAHTGVNLFFVVSGFVFAPYLFGRQLHVRAHAVRRLFRIYPAYVLALGVYVAMKAQAGQPLLYVGEHLAFAHVQNKDMAFYYNPPFWSLPAEVEFYLALPLLAGMARLTDRWRGPRARDALLLGLLLGAGGLRWALGWASDTQAQNAAFIALHHLPGVLVEFLLGAAAWRVSMHSLSPVGRSSMVLAGVTGWATLAVWFAQVGDAGLEASPARGLIGAMSAVCFALMVAGTVRSTGPGTAATLLNSVAVPERGQTGPWARQVRAGLMALALWAGHLSYGVYLFHMAALRAAEAWAPGWGLGGSRALAVVLTLAIATAVYLAWENPWRLLGRRWAARLKG